MWTSGDDMTWRENRNAWILLRHYNAISGRGRRKEGLIGRSTVQFSWLKESKRRKAKTEKKAVEPSPGLIWHDYLLMLPPPMGFLLLKLT